LRENTRTLYHIVRTRTVSKHGENARTLYQQI
jgi:hypothetical protein